VLAAKIEVPLPDGLAAHRVRYALEETLAVTGIHSEASAARVCCNRGASPAGRKHLLVFAAAVAVLHANMMRAEEVAQNRLVEFRAAGIVSISRPGGETLADRAFNFEVFVKGNRWLIRTVPFGLLTNSSSTTVESYQAGTDGTNVYSVAVHNPLYDKRRGQEEALATLRAEEEQLLAGKDTNPQLLSATRRMIDNLSRQRSMPEARNQATGEIIVGTIPPFREDELIAAIWLALCSQPVIGVTNLAPAVFHAKSGDEPLNSELFVDAEVRRSAQFPYVPEFVGFSNTGVRLPSGVASGAQPKPYKGLEGPFRVATYEASISRHGALALPSAFEIRRYAVSTKSGLPQLRYQITGRISEVSPSVELEDFRPELAVVAAVADHRHVDDTLRSSVRVFTERGEWPSVERVRTTKEYLRASTQGTRRTHKTKLIRTTILLSIALLTVPLAMLAWKVNRKTTKPNQ
jgi:hypothetical protein